MPRRPRKLALFLPLLCGLGTGCATLQSLDKKVQPGGTLPAELIAKGEPGPAVLPTLGPPPPIPEPMTLPPRLAAPAPVPAPPIVAAAKPAPPAVAARPLATSKADPGVLPVKAMPDPRPQPEPEPPSPAGPRPVAPAPIPKPTPTPTPKSKPPGRVVATVGDEVVTLPELTAAVKARLAELETGGGGNLGRRQVIALAKNVLKGLVARSLVEQEARERLGADYDGVVRELETRWERNEAKLVQAKEEVTSEADLRRVLARRQTTPEAVRDEFLIRGLAQEVLDRQGATMSLETYLDDLARRRPVQTVMTPAELAAEGKKEAEKAK